MQMQEPQSTEIVPVSRIEYTVDGQDKESGNGIGGASSSGAGGGAEAESVNYTSTGN